MINNFFKIIRIYFYKNRLPRIISFYNLNKNNLNDVRNIAIWLMCLEKNKLICKKCKSCASFKKNINYDYYESLEYNTDEQHISNLDKFFKITPIFSNIKVAFLYLCVENQNILKSLEEKLKNQHTYILYCFNNSLLEINNSALNFNNKKKNLISINIVKLMYSKILNKTNNVNNTNVFFFNKFLVIDSIIFFIQINLYYFYFKKKSKILMNKQIKEKMLKKNVFFILNLLEKYKKILTENNNLNILLLINFIIDYINN